VDTPVKVSRATQIGAAQTLDQLGL
jgi:hypothetical protein